VLAAGGGVAVATGWAPAAGAIDLSATGETAATLRVADEAAMPEIALGPGVALGPEIALGPGVASPVGDETLTARSASESAVTLVAEAGNACDAVRVSAPSVSISVLLPRDGPRRGASLRTEADVGFDAEESRPEGGSETAGVLPASVSAGSPSAAGSTGTADRSGLPIVCAEPLEDPAELGRGETTLSGDRRSDVSDARVSEESLLAVSA
jgi:hypothetical protein